MSTPRYLGACLCGGVRYEVDADIKAVSHCHCSMCRKAHGAAFGTYGSVQNEQHRFTQGTDLLREYRSSPDVTRMFCSVCGSPLLWRSTARSAGWLSFPLGTLETPYVPTKQRHIHVASKALWYTIGDGQP